MKWYEHPLINLLVSVFVLMALFSGAKIGLNRLPDGGLIGAVKRFFMLA